MSGGISPDAPAGGPPPADAQVPASAPETVQPSPAPSGDTTPSPSVNEQGDTKQALLDAVLKAIPEEESRPDPDVIKPGQEDGSPPSSETEPGKPEEDLGEITPEELAGYHSKSRKRIKDLLAERTALSEERDSLKAEVGVVHGLRGYLKENDISKDDFSLTLDIITALRRGDFRTFYEGVRPYVDLAEQALGLALPPDMQQRVQEGHMTTQAAAIMTQERINRVLAEERANNVTQRVQYQQTAQQTHEARETIRGSVAQWEAATARTDPDFAMKQAAANDIVWAVMRETGPPTNPQQAVAIAQEAYRRAGNHLRSVAPGPRATPAVPSSATRSNGATAAPKSFMEAAMRGLERSR
jgi:hypothetical protein